MSNTDIISKAYDTLSGKWFGWLWAFPLIYVSNAVFYEYLKNKQQITKSE